MDIICFIMGIAYIAYGLKAKATIDKLSKKDISEITAKEVSDLVVSEMFSMPAIIFGVIAVSFLAVYRIALFCVSQP